MSHDHFTKLQWACRRGMLELDVLLGNFLKERVASLTIEDKNLFVLLLQASDPELMEWLLGQAVPADRGLAQMIEQIRHHAQSRIRT